MTLLDINPPRGTTSFPTEHVFIILPIAVIIEELIFRIAPLIIAVRLFDTLWKVLIVGILTSIVFGFAHGSIAHIFLQGIMGMLYVILFLKCGGLSGKPGQYLKKYSKASLAVIAAHMIHNGILLAVSFIGMTNY